jgi:D-glucuronyl C5-epimerase C-terminus
MRPTSRSVRGTLVGCVAVAILLVVEATVVDSSVSTAATPYRVGRFELADVCTDGLSWTNHPPPRIPAPRPRDRNGVPLYRVSDQLYYRPGALAINGMKRIDAYRDHGDERQLEVALKEASRLRMMSLRRRYADWLPYWYDWPPAGAQAPWFDAMTQGLGLSFYVRLYRVTGDAIHLDAAHDLFKSYMRLGRRLRPWVAYVDPDGYLWLEHNLGRLPRHILNAHLHAVFGIYEYWQVTRSLEARRVLRGAITTMSRHAQRYRRPGGVSFYGLLTRTIIFKYHEIHIWQLRLLAKISGHADFARLSRQLERDAPPIGRVNGRPARQGDRVVGPHCRPPRANGLDAK